MHRDEGGGCVEMSIEMRGSVCRDEGGRVRRGCVEMRGEGA